VLGRIGTSEALDLLKAIAQSARSKEVFELSIEVLVKSMSAPEARQFCLGELRKVAPNPDTSSEKVIVLLRGLFLELNPEDNVLLKAILRKTKNDAVRRACFAKLAEWMLNSAAWREELLENLETGLSDEDCSVRTASIRGLAESGDIQYIRLLIPVLQDQDIRVRTAAAEGICRLVNWEVPDVEGIEPRKQWLKELQYRVKPLVEALDSFNASLGNTKE